MQKIKSTILLLLSICYSLHYYAQSETDSLINLINKTNEDTTKINLYNELCWVIYTDNPLEAKKYGNLAIELAKKINFETGLSEAYNKMGILEKETGNYQEALDYYQLSMDLSVKLKDSLGICMLYNNIGNVYKSKGDYPLALENLFNAIKFNELLKRVDGQADGLVNIGLIYDDLKNNELALKYLEQSLALATKINDKKRTSRALMNIGNLYSGGKNDDKQKALDYYNQALNIDAESGDKRGQSMCLNNIGAVYFDLGQWQKAEEYYFKSLKIKEETGDRKGIAVINENLAFIEQEKKDYKKANFYFSKALSIIDSIGNMGLKISLLQSLADNYYLMKDYKTSAETLKTLFQLNDSIFNSEMTSQLSEMQAKYETEKKDKEILVLQKNKEIQDKEIGRQKVVRNSIIGFSALILLLLIGSIIAFKEKKKANIKLALQNEEIMQQKEEIETQRDLLTVRNEEILQNQEEIIAQRDEIEAQRDTVIKQRDQIEEIHKEVTDSINYAKRIQEAMLPDLESEKVSGGESEYENESAKVREGESENQHIVSQSPFLKVSLSQSPTVPTSKSLTFETFILFKPKDVVSGDFYWFSKVNDYLIYAVADCTGHGVPGAFMSMLGISFLNEIVSKKEVTQASHVLDQLRVSIIDALKQTGESGTQKDGMDMSLVVIKSQVQSSKSQEEESEKVRQGESKQSADNDTELQSSEMRCVEPVETFIEKESNNNKDLSSKYQIPNSKLQDLESEKLQSSEMFIEKEPTTNLVAITNNIQGAQVPCDNDLSSKSQISNSKFQGNDEQLNIRTIEHANHELQTTTELASSTKLNNKQSYHAQWAGANNPLWIVRAVTQSSGLLVEPEVRDTKSPNFKNIDETTNQRLVLQEVKPDKMPIAIYERMNKFTNHEFQLNTGDILYLMSDGYEDQFGGLKFKKFLSKNLKQLLVANCQLPMNEQKEVLEKTLVDWIGSGEQIDDITILGIRI
ncbi:MAG: hypothetical protein A2033_12075 [Bacteroidetes bacterium GWA2_31_9]|nr:MAG: hypothetical protein A2033_12075 [Bacteroidetes bacterium GWA2_31_9]